MADIHLPDDIIQEILSRCSSVKTLLRLTLLSKFFRNLITRDRVFAHSHLSRATRHVHMVTYNGYIYRSTEFDCEKDHENFLLKCKKKSFSDPLNLGEDIRVLGSCNGIIYFYRSSWGYDNNYRVYLWNPSLHQIRSFVLQNVKFCEDLIGFGYDPISQDYKLVHISTRLSKVQVYSLKNDVWKSYTCNIRIGGIRRNSAKAPLEFNGSLYWILLDGSYTCSFYTFRLSDNSVSEFVLPENIFLDGDYSLGVFKGCVSLLCVRIPDYEIWSMSRNGDWVKTFDHKDGSRDIFSGVVLNWQFTAYGKLLITAECKRILFDPETKTSTELGLMGVDPYNKHLYSIDYVESLISVNPLTS